MIRRFFARVALWSLFAGFPSLRRAPRGRLARARILEYGIGSGHVMFMRGPVLVVGVPLCDWCGPLGRWLCRLAFRVVL